MGWDMPRGFAPSAPQLPPKEHLSGTAVCWTCLQPRVQKQPSREDGQSQETDGRPSPAMPSRGCSHLRAGMSYSFQTLISVGGTVPALPSLGWPSPVFQRDTGSKAQLFSVKR